MKDLNLTVPIDIDNISIEKIEEKCLSCGYCRKVCDNDITVGKMYNLKDTIKPICINCGQCANICPTESIREKSDYSKVKKIIKDKTKTIIVNIAPAVRVALGEEFGFEKGINCEKKIVTVLKKLGAKYVLDITFGADLTIMEEAQELITRIKENKNLPQFTSCCPAWVKYVEIFYPDLLPNLSTCKSPISMQGATIKTYFAKQNNINPKDIINIVIAPCTAKKYEIQRKELIDSSKYNNIADIKDNDYVLTTRELAKWIKEENIDFFNISDTDFDSPLTKGSGAASIFGNTGGVMEAALRTAYYFVTKKDLPKNKLKFENVRGIQGIKEANVDFDGLNVKVAIANGMKNAKLLIDKIKKGECMYHFIEVMNCDGGCIAGGGQPKVTMLEMHEAKLKRIEGLYKDDEKNTLRVSYKNPEIVEIYKKFYNKPNSELAEKLLHTKYENKSYMINIKREK